MASPLQVSLQQYEHISHYLSTCGKHIYPAIFSVPFWNTLSLWVSLTVTEQVSHPHNIIVSYTFPTTYLLIFTFMDRRCKERRFWTAWCWQNFYGCHKRQICLSSWTVGPPVPDKGRWPAPPGWGMGVGVTSSLRERSIVSEMCQWGRHGLKMGRSAKKRKDWMAVKFEQK